MNTTNINTQGSSNQFSTNKSGSAPDLPGPSIFGIFTSVFQTSQSIQDIEKAQQQQDHEGRLDAYITLSQQPFSFLNAAGSLAIKITEIGSYCHLFENTKFILPLNKAVCGLGLIVCVGEIAYEAIGLKRAIAFSSEFIHSHAPNTKELNNPKQLHEVIRWAKKTEKIAERLFHNHPQREEFKIIQLNCQNIIAEKKSSSPQHIKIAQLVDKVHKQAVIADLTTLNTNYIQCQDSAQKKEKLLKRLELNFVQNATESLPQLIQDLALNLQEPTHNKPIDLTTQESSSEALPKAEKLLELMEIQTQKKVISHTIAIFGCALLLTGLILGLSIACPIIPTALMIAGSLVGVIRYLFWAGYSNSTGWNCELDKWVNFKIQSIVQFLETNTSTISEGLLTASSFDRMHVFG